MALSHEQPDRCPMQISFTPEFALRLRKDIGQESVSSHNPHGGGNTYELERWLDEDILQTSIGWAKAYYQDDKAYTDEWGVGWDVFEYDTKFGKGYYTETVKHPLAEDSAIDSYQPPDPNRPVEKLGPDGGIFIGSSSEVHDLIPIENVQVMYQTVHEYGTYPIDVERICRRRAEIRDKLTTRIIR